MSGKHTMTHYKMKENHPNLEICDYANSYQEMRFRIWKRFKTNNSEGNKSVIVIMQEPQYFDDKIEDTIVNVYKKIIGEDFPITPSHIYFFNNCATEKKNFENCKIQIENKKKLLEINEINTERLSSIIEKVDYVFDARGKLDNQDIFAGCNVMEVIKESIDKILDKNKNKVYTFTRDDYCFYPGDHGGAINGMKKI